jgi:site-specific DNA-methyltransferase (adenine-specific)
MEYKVVCLDGIIGMQGIPDKSIDLVLTDPPYNAKNIGPHKRVYSLGTMAMPPEVYADFCRRWFKEAQRITDTIVFTPGIGNICLYPQPTWVICWHKPAACSFSRLGGYNAWEPIFVYGKPTKRIGQDYVLYNTFNFKKGEERNHPCPKQFDLWTWLVLNFSEEGDNVCDPFSGSGTTAVACKQQNRGSINYEINPEYCRIANKRLEQEVLSNWLDSPQATGVGGGEIMPKLPPHPHEKGDND